MLEWFRDRFKHLRLLWEQKALSRWAALFSLAYTLFVVWRDEFATPEQQENIRGIKMLPNWPLSVWVCIFFAVLCIWIFEASFRLQKGLADKTAHGLSLLGLIPVLDPTNPANAFEIRLSLRNSADFPVRFEVTELISTFGPTTTKSVGTPGVIPSRGESTFMANIGVPKKDFLKLPSRGLGEVRYKMLYGNASGPFSRAAEKEIEVTYVKRGSKQVDVIWTVRKERDEPI
jgi:hypothetical protein